MLKEWLDSLKASQASRDFKNGYNYAAGMLLKHGRVAIPYLEEKAGGDFVTSFDIGMLDAIRDYCRIGPMKTDWS